MRTLFLVHKWLGLIFSLPLIVLSITGFILAIAPHQERGKGEALENLLPVHQILDEQKKLYPSASIGRAGFSPTDVTVMLREKGMRVLKISRADGSVLSDKKPSDDFFVFSKMIHESFLLQDIGKKLVAFSGLALVFILISGTLFWGLKNFRKKFLQLFRKESFTRLKPFHIFIGVLFLLPLLFSSITGTLIELNSVFFSDREPIPHEKPVSCSWEEQLSVIKERAKGGGQIFFCRPGSPYISINGRDGSRMYTPSNEEVLFVPKEDWKGQRGARKHWFVHWHGGENFGAFEFPYQLMTSFPLLILVVSGAVLWARKKRKV